MVKVTENDVVQKGLLFLIYASKSLMQGHSYGVVVFEDGREELVLLNSPSVVPSESVEVVLTSPFLKFSSAQVMPDVPQLIQVQHSRGKIGSCPSV